MSLKQHVKEEHQKKINLVINYISNHLSEKLDLKKLSRISAISPYHFHRIMTAYLGEPLGTYIIRNRIETAAQLLKHTSMRIDEIAFKIGYDCPTSFAKAFKKHFEMSPSEFRASQNLEDQNKSTSLIHKGELPKDFVLKPKIVTRKEKMVIYLRLIGDYRFNDYNTAWEKIWNFVKEKRLYTFRQESLGLCYDDPTITEVEKCRYECCITINKKISPEGDIGVKTIHGGKYAVFKFRGNIDYVGAVYDAIYNTWFPQSDYELRDVPAFEKYVKFSKKNPARNKTEIFIPIK